jgi:Flp pilus assembly protein TadB
MSQHAPLRVRDARPPSPAGQAGPGAALLRRRESAARVRRRRLLLVDLGLGALIAVIGLILAGGLAIASLGAFVVLAGCGVWGAVERLHARRRSDRRVHERRPRSGDGDSA